MCILVLYLTVLILSLTTEPMMNSALRPEGVFFLFSALSLMAVFFLYGYMGETKDLGRAEKKALYIPGGQWGRKLTPHDIPPSLQMDSETASKHHAQKLDDE